ncbi:hypothetical protein WK00_14325 [Burkholderia ubonensis]|nr:hypothetical protein WK00_14325 [Burkholderia ubonensis]
MSTSRRRGHIAFDPGFYHLAKLTMDLPSQLQIVRRKLAIEDADTMEIHIVNRVPHRDSNVSR